MEFETNRGRVFTYDSQNSSKDPQEMVTFKAKPGQEIICLKVHFDHSFYFYTLIKKLDHIWPFLTTLVIPGRPHGAGGPGGGSQ